MSEYPEIKNESNSFLHITDRLFLMTIIAQFAGTCLIFVAVAFTSLCLKASNDVIRIKSIFSNFDKATTESVFIAEVTHQDFSSTQHILDQFKNALLAQEIQCDVVVAELPRSPADVKISLKLGDKILKHSLFVEPKFTFVTVGLKWVGIATALSLIIISLVWLGIRKKLYQAVMMPLLDSVRADAKDAVVGRLAAQVAHDIRSPVSLLNVLADTAKEMAEPHRALLRLATERRDRISNELEPKNGSVNISIATGKPAVDIAREIVFEKNELYRPLGIKINLVIDQGSSGLVVSIDQVEFGRALSNLIDNSVEATRSIAEVPKIDIYFQRNKLGEVMMLIKDNGTGMSEEVVQKLGTRGFSLGKSSGKGLGLYHARNLVENAGGTFTVSSKINMGTAITLSLPTA